jgi:hypothetical protein
MTDLPRWMQKPEQPAAGNGAAIAPASPAPKPDGSAAPAGPAPSPLHVRSHLDGIATPDALEAAAAVEDQRAQEIADEMDAPPKKPGDYKFIDPPPGSGVQPMTGTERVAVAQLLHSFGTSPGLAQAIIAADYAAQASAAPRGEPALHAASLAAMDKLALGIVDSTGASYEVARTAAETLAIEVDEYIFDLARRKDPRVWTWWSTTSAHCDVALLKRIHAFIGRAKQRAARSS